MFIRLAIFLAIGLAAVPALAAGVYPPAPQTPDAHDGIDGPGFVRVVPGGSGPIDVHGVCRIVTNTGDKEVVVPVATPQEWQSFVSHASGPVTVGPC